MSHNTDNGQPVSHTMTTPNTAEARILARALHTLGLDGSAEMMDALADELEVQDRILRSSVPERWKSCTCPVGAAQSYIAELEADLERLRAQVAPAGWIDINDRIPPPASPAALAQQAEPCTSSQPSARRPDIYCPNQRCGIVGGCARAPAQQAAPSLTAGERAAPTIPSSIIQLVSAYGDSRADGVLVGDSLGAVIKALRAWGAGLAQPAAQGVGELSPLTHVIDERDAYAKELAACRDAFPIPAQGAATEGAWMIAMDDPLTVANYVRAALDQAQQACPVTAKEKP